MDIEFYLRNALWRLVRPKRKQLKPSTVRIKPSNIPLSKKQNNPITVDSPKQQRVTLRLKTQSCRTRAKLKATLVFIKPSQRKLTRTVYQLNETPSHFIALCYDYVAKLESLDYMLVDIAITRYPFMIQKGGIPISIKQKIPAM